MKTKNPDLVGVFYKQLALLSKGENKILHYS